MAFSEDFIAELKFNNRIEDVIGSYAQLKRSGQDYVCLCPFHSEKSPSFHVYTSNQSFYCFGCNKGGSVITFIMEQEALSFQEAVRFLCQRAGMSMPDEVKNSPESHLKLRILAANRAAGLFYNHLLMKERAGEKGRLYFRDRQLTVNTITKYGLGYAPPEWSALTDHLLSQGFSEDELISANLSRRSQRGTLYDFFRDRVMFPIIDLRGNVIGFGGRIIDGEGPKYLNSPDTPVFKKSRNLFSMNFAKRSKERRLILAEGYMDVISINQAGIENVVATLGTALTSEQVNLISNYADEVIISYDSDGAGQTAAMRALNLFSSTNITTKVLKVEGAKDPDEFLKKYGVLRFRQLLDNSDGAVNFELSRCSEGLDITSDIGKVELLKRSAKVIANIQSPVERNFYTLKVASEQGISPDALKEQVKLISASARKKERRNEWDEVRSLNIRSSDPAQRRDPGRFNAERSLIACLYRHPDDRAYISSKVSPDDLTSENNRAIYAAMCRILAEQKTDLMLMIQEYITSDQMGIFSSIIAEYRSIDLGASVRDELIKKVTSHKSDGDEPDLLSIAERKKKGR